MNRFVFGGETMTIEDRIVARFIEKIKQDKEIPEEIIPLIEALSRQGGLKNVDAVLNAIKQGAKTDGKSITS